MSRDYHTHRTGAGVSQPSPLLRERPSIQTLRANSVARIGVWTGGCPLAQSLKLYLCYSCFYHHKSSQRKVNTIFSLIIEQSRPSCSSTIIINCSSKKKSSHQTTIHLLGLLNLSQRLEREEGKKRNGRRKPKAFISAGQVNCIDYRRRKMLLILPYLLLLAGGCWTPRLLVGVSAATDPATG